MLAVYAAIPASCEKVELAAGGNGIRLVDFAIRLRIRSWALVIR